ncbi:MAG: hypothetical protein IPJ13_26355 [Saprospiraceae bacterium]|nr:hypothetical protein [Saprospiraceae bacterium]
MHIIIDIPKKEQSGEDAPPINLEIISDRIRVISVFDGLGGSGSTIYEENGEKNTGAYIASRVTRNSTFVYFDKLKNQNTPYEINSALVENLKNQIISNLNDTLKLQKYEISKLKSSLIRTFPTTIALIHAELSEENQAKIDVV